MSFNKLFYLFQQCAVEVVHIPVFTISLTNVVFVTPPYNHIYPLFEGKLMPQSPSVDLYSLSNNERSEARRLASALNSMLDSMNLKEDIYYVGAYSSLLAGILENSPVCLARRKVNYLELTILQVKKKLHKPSHCEIMLNHKSSKLSELFAPSLTYNSGSDSRCVWCHQSLNRVSAG